ncbi:TetR/AcrR family transcriptional regulator C-terminal domain-containing protein [Herpetosiphon llansteffanensis]|uniref:TetR/AcrR family transcriptional regulator C-terminal domain-containing protein n=1 Tax=Herpetosiphon llansteffanensis TaxID=2094568 RepID=UPI000D7C3359|nr:TetR/AcrR family transcriptional regulator C-terminal domain-containing protein [Herpetosiphon llansteffanensis]
MPISKSQIVAIALEMLNQDGLEGVTLRRLATQLNVKAASLYHHIPSKEHLLDAMAGQILAQGFAGWDFTNDQRDWAEWLNLLAQQLRRSLLAYREGARVVAGAHPNAAATLMLLWDLTVRVLVNAGFALNQTIDITLTLINFTFGWVIEEQTSPPTAQNPHAPVSELSALAHHSSLFAQAFSEWLTRDTDSHFSAGVRMIINGVSIEKPV